MKLKQKVASCGSQMQKIGVFGWERHISPKNVGSFGDSRDNQQKYGVIGWKKGVFGALYPCHLHNGSAPLDGTMF